MPFLPTPIQDLLIYEPTRWADDRGYFYESYNEHTFAAAGVSHHFVQDNQARSSQGVLRGLHYQHGEHAQAKLVRVIEGMVYDVAVDLRPHSPTRYQWYGLYLSADNHRQFFVPRGFAHGYLVLSEHATFVYKCDNFYQQSAEGGLRYDDPRLGIEWPTLAAPYVLSAKDEAWPLLTN